MRRISFIMILFFFVTVPVRAQLSADEQQTISIFEKVSPSVVFIKNAALQWDWFSDNIYEVPTGAGSGFIWDDQGHIVTNFHVIYEADRIQVVLSDQKVYDASVVGYSPDHDLAVLKIDAPKEDLPPVTVGASKGLRVGQKALSIGNPFGLDHSLTTGVVSALGRNIRSITGRQIYDVIQTDAAINPGNSGGPLLNSQGQVIGISTAIYSPSGADAGVGFAIPIDEVKRIVPQLIKYGKVKRATLGIILVPDRVRDDMGLEGAMILAVQPTGPAAQAGLQQTQRDIYGNVVPGDVIVSLDEHLITNNDDLVRVLEENYKAGDKVMVAFMRGKKKGAVEVVLQELNF